MSEQTEPEIIYVNGNPIVMRVSREHCLNFLKQLMLAETYPELTKVNSEPVRRTKKARKSSD